MTTRRPRAPRRPSIRSDPSCCIVLCGASILSPLRPGHEYRPALDEAVGLGCNIVRTFCGALPWCGQEIGHVYERPADLPGRVQARGLNGYLAYHTEAGTGYDLEQPHRRGRGDRARQYPGRRAARGRRTKPTHETQGGRLDAGALRRPRRSDGRRRVVRRHARGRRIATVRRPRPTSVHLDRGRDPWNMVRRVREIYAHTERSTGPRTTRSPSAPRNTTKPARAAPTRRSS